MTDIGNPGSIVIEPEKLAQQAGHLAGAGHLPMLVIYARPSDFPDAYVVRLFCDGLAMTLCSIFRTLEAARAMIPDRHFVRMERNEGDDPVIVETWI